MKKSSSDFGAISPGESMVAFTAAEGTHVEMVILMEGGALGGGVGSLDVPVNTECLVIRGGKTETRTAFRPGDLPVGEFGWSGGFKMEENGVPPLRADKTVVEGDLPLPDEKGWEEVCKWVGPCGRVLWEKGPRLPWYLGWTTGPRNRRLGRIHEFLEFFTQFVTLFSNAQCHVVIGRTKF